MKAVFALVLLLAFHPAMDAQTTTGSITGTVLDPSGAAVVGADVQLVSSATQAKRQAKTDSAGLFEFNVLDPGVYNLLIAAKGFRREERSQINLTASERLALGNLTLQVGNVSDSVVVQAQRGSNWSMHCSHKPQHRH